MSTTSPTPVTPVTGQAELSPSLIDGPSQPLITAEGADLFPASASPADRPKLRTAGQIAYPVFTLALVIGAVVLGAHVVSQPTPVEEPTTPPVAAEPQPPAPPGAADAVAAVIDPTLIDVTVAAPDVDGVRIEGTVTEVALASPELLGAHIEQVLQNNCVDNLHLEAADNLAIDFWGHCFTTQSADLIADTIDYALETGALSSNLQDYPGSGNYRRASFVWQTADPAEYERIAESWSQQEMPDGLNAVNFTQYGADELAGEMVYADLTRDGLEMHQAPEEQ